MLIEYGVWVLRLALAGVFGLSAWGKWADRSGTGQAMAEFGVPVRWAPVAARVLPVVEAVLAVGLLLPRAGVGAGVLALVLLLVFTAAVGRLLRRGKHPACSCFGAMSAPIGGRTLIRNGVLIAMAVLVTAGSIGYPRVPLGLSVERAVGTAVAAGLAALVVLLFGEVRALRRRVDEQALSTLGAEGLPVGAVAPEFELLDTRGGRVSLETLQRNGRQLLLVFVHPACEMCAALARELPRWRVRAQRALTIAVVGNGAVDEYAEWGRRQGLGEIPVLVQQGNEAALRYRVRGTPSGVLIDAEGRVAAPVARGAMAIRELIGRAEAVARQ
ncbi:redoxin domain-containing protein [Nocardia sp. CDC159]|uniref:Redoxin domain-containing protein n=1 Tax=Nocardia pulmonis TaxID=2951408 RepID=A0A9X2EEV3_9NOCA|nr:MULTISPECIES: MauE/DoxX family redox-associated membrane protein [Nocardia]MCM6776881.1 redoxin domain-containing protein [Nocardia pulmonis]MCM6789305.1 redoxin domain-containing protein [Nocardia sp. CDC159]